MGRWLSRPPSSLSEWGTALHGRAGTVVEAADGFAAGRRLTLARRLRGAPVR